MAAAAEPPDKFEAEVPLGEDDEVADVLPYEDYDCCAGPLSCADFLRQPRNLKISAYLSVVQIVRRLTTTPPPNWHGPCATCAQVAHAHRSRLGGRVWAMVQTSLLGWLIGCLFYDPDQIPITLTMSTPPFVAAIADRRRPSVGVMAQLVDGVVVPVWTAPSACCG